jgi:uncharacterized NAD(P)/FAD-binding protein YdhS
MSSSGSRRRVVIVGGGASGALTAGQLLRCSAARQLPLDITLIDRHGRHGLGVAYSSGLDAHLLNAPAGQMSALPGDWEHLIRWANSAGRRYLPAGMTEVGADTFLPRPAYGQYLLEMLADAQRRAAPTAQLTRLTAEAVDIRPGAAGQPVQIRLADGGVITADATVLATGQLPPRLPFDAPVTDRVIADPWYPRELGRLLDHTGPASVVIVGTGLTMIDIAVAMADANPETIIAAVSRHGLLPRRHPGVTGPAPALGWPAGCRPGAPVRLSDLTAQVRAAISARPDDWHNVISSLRPLTPGLWHRMSRSDQRLFLRHLARYWEVHRHPVPPQTASRVTGLRQTGRLTVRRGAVISVTGQTDGRLRVDLATGHDGTGTDRTSLVADWIVNASGWGGDTRSATTVPLFRNLFAAGTARPDPLGLGLDAAESGALLDEDGVPSAVLFTLGPPLRGLWYETTAIPEIRDQAAVLARHLTSTVLTRRQYRPGSAA